MVESHTFPTIAYQPLTAANGSVKYTSPSSTHTLICGVNYPLEVPFRSDEDPESTYIEVSVRPHNSVSMVRERYIEEIVRKTLRSVVLGQDTPRCMLQCTVQIIEMSVDESLPGGVKDGYQGQGCLDLLVGAVNASILGCLDAAVRMSGLVGAVLVGVIEDGGGFVISPDVSGCKKCESLHAFGFASSGKCVLMESEGSFEPGEWEQAEQLAREVVCGTPHEIQSAGGTSGDVDMDTAGQASCLFEAIRKSVEFRAVQETRWRS